MPQQDITTQRPIRIQFFRFRKCFWIHGRFRRGNKYYLALQNLLHLLLRAATSLLLLTIINNHRIPSRHARHTRHDAGVAHTLKDETLKFAIRGVVVIGLVGEVDDAGFVSGVLRKEEEVDEEGGLLSEISCYGGGDSDDVAYEVAQREVGVEEGFVDSVGVGTDLVEGKGLAMVHDNPGGGERDILFKGEEKKKKELLTS